MHPILPFLVVSSALAYDTHPLVIPWNTTHSYGPDGPWPVVTVQIGNSDAAGTQPLSTVDLHPGGIWESMVLTDVSCNANGMVASNTSSPCLGDKVGLYYSSASETAIQNFTDAVGLIWQWESDQTTDLQGKAVNVLDTVRMQALTGPFGIPNSTISAVNAWQIQLPDGTYYSAQVGTLSLGAPGTGEQQFGDNWTGQTIPGFMSASGITASNSWGLHYGSVPLNQEGSLVFGGYDQSRVLGDVGAFDLGAGSTMLLTLVDIQIGVEIGSSPFGESSYVGLLKLNSSLNGLQPAIVNPIVPYLFMSPETCAAVAEKLPVTFNAQVGLYIWNTTDPQYEMIVDSPAYLAFIILNEGGGNLTIKVPFRLLNLTLEAPIVVTTQQYFPCRPFHATDQSSNYFLGKAFLQAAFVGMNWQIPKFFLAQAPGPRVGTSNIKSIEPSDTMISADPIENFAVTWARDWTTLSDTANDGNSSESPTTNATNGNSGGENSKSLTALPTGTANGHEATSGSALSSRTKAGMAVGTVVGVIAVAAAGMLCYSKKSSTMVPPQEEDFTTEQDPVVYETDGRLHRLEFGEGLPHEADNDREIHELGVRETP